MCSITGAVPLTPTAEVDPSEYGRILSAALERGRDAWGIATKHHVLRSPETYDLTKHGSQVEDIVAQSRGSWVIGLNRGEPTTEHFGVGVDGLAPHDDLNPRPEWVTVHNGTIANDHELARMFALPERGIDSRVLPHVMGLTKPDAQDIAYVIQRHVRGSYALAAGKRDGSLVLACNYKPIFHCVLDDVLYFASLPHHLPGYGTLRSTVQKLRPYTTMYVSPSKRVQIGWIGGGSGKRERSLVVLSGGLDSTTVLASEVAHLGAKHVAAMHVSYGCHATGRELEAVTTICQRLGVDLHLLATDAFEAIGGSTLLCGSGADAVSGQAGSEYAHEWVPARNLILASLAVGLAETEGFDRIALGNNLEESGAYPDNEQEFIRALNAVLPNAVQEGRRVRFVEPVGNLMKHEIVKLGLELDAPLDLTYSCYRGGDMHCGRCGPCFMRHNAFRMNGAVDPLPYEQEVEMPA